MPVLKYFDPTDSTWKVLTAGGGTGGSGIAVQEEAPTEPADGDLWLDTDETGVEAGTSGGGGVSGVDDPTTFNAVFGDDLGYDYEFGGSGVTTPPTGWAWLNQGTSTYDEAFGAGVLSPQMSAGDFDWRALIQPVPTEATWTLTAKLHFALSNSANYASSGIVMTDGTKVSGFGPRHNNAVAHGTFISSKWANVTTYDSDWASTLYPGGGAVYPYHRLIKNSPTSYEYWISPDGRTWGIVTPAFDMSAWMTPTHIGFGTTVSQNASIGKVGVEWFRVRSA